jgi:choline dehydrogenase
MIQLALSNWTNNSASIVSQAKAIDPTTVLNNVDPTVLSGYEKQRTVIMKDINTEGVGGLSWNTGPETSIYMTRPLSRGSIKINSTSILTDPLIDYGALTDPTDLSMLYAIYMKNRELMSTLDIAVLGPIETSPAPDTDDEAEIKEAIKRALQPSNAHQCCTAAMMKREDASTFPLVPGGGPQASVYAWAEKVILLPRWAACLY